MNPDIPDLKVDAVRLSFLDRLSGFCLILGFGHFLGLVPLYLIFRKNLNEPFLGTLILSGTALLLIAFLCRIQRIRRVLSYFCFFLLFGQCGYYLSQGTTLYHPLTMLFPLLCALATPSLGRRSAYLIAGISSVLFLYLHFFRFYSLEYNKIPALLLIELVLFMTAYLSEVLWDGVARRERDLRWALAELKSKSEEMEQWIRQLGDATELISSGRATTALPIPPPSQIFETLTRSMGQMQTKLNEYFTNLFLEDRLKSLGVLASGVAHELNTPLTTMQFLLQEDPNLSAETRELLSLEIDRMGKIARGLLSFARPSSEQIIDLNQVVRATEPLLRRLTSPKIRLEFHLGEAPIPIQGLQNEIQQILLNLFQNAADALEDIPDASICLQTKKASETIAELCVQDNGIGIEKAALGKILDPFFTTKPPGKGTGLGLFITHQIVNRHNGRLEIESQPGGGTTVRLIFPLCEAVAKTGEPTRQSAAG